MGVSFKVAKAGTRYRPKQGQTEEKEIENDSPTESQQREKEGDLVGVGDKVAGHSNALAKRRSLLVSEDFEVSFSLNLFPDGFSIGKANESLNVVSRQLHPYDRASETLFCAIECGCLPGDIFDDIPCKYVNGALICEIRDYRNILSQKGNTVSSAGKSPIIHKVVLQMCMENIVKDVSSISDDSWTYKDLLEVEARILKTLRPDLHLNPKPMLNSFCEDPLTKKLNLGIAWNRKKRKLSNELATGLELCNSFPGTHISDVNITQNSQCQPDLPSQDRGVPCSQHIVQSPIVTSQENNIMNGTISQSSASQFQSNYQLAVDSHQSVSNSLTPSSFVSSPKPNYNNCLSNLRKPSTLTLGEREKCGKVANQEHIIKKPKQEPLDFSQQQLPGRLAETTLDAELQRKNKLFKHRIEAEKSSRERTHDNAHPSLLMSSAQQAPLEGIPKLQHGMLTCRLKKKPTESNSFPSLDSQNTKSKCNIIGIRNNQSSLQQSQLLRSSPVMKADGPPTPMQWNHMGQSVGKNMTNVIFNQKGRASRNYQVFTGVGNASVSSCFNDSLPREASVSTKRKSNYLPKGLSMNRVESPANTSIMNTANAICPSVDSPMCRPSGIVGPVSILETSVPGPSVIGDPILDRVSKMKLVSQRYGLNQRKCKFSQVLERKQIFHTKLVALHLMHSRDKENSKDSHTNRTSYSRTLTFARSSHASQGNQIPSSEDQNKLILLEKLDEGMVEASAIYGHERNDPLELPLLQIFPGTHHVDLFAAQFTALMAREGYHLADNQIEPASLATDGSSTSQQPTVTTTSETVELPPPIPIPGQAPCMLGPMSSMSGLNPCQLPSQCNFSGAHLLPPGNIHSTPHLSAGYLSKPQLDFAPQLNPLHPQWQHVIDKRAFLQFQMLQRLGLQWQLLQKRMMTGGLGAATGCSSMMQLGSGAEWLGNIGLGSSDNVLGMRGSTPVLMRENIPRIGNSGEGNIPAAVLARMRMAENQGRALWSEVPIQRNPGILPAYQPNFSAMAYEGINQQMSLLQIRQQLYVLPQQQQHEMGSPIQSTGGTGLAEHVVSPPSQVGRHQMDQMSPHQLNSVMVPQKVDPGNVVADHENPGISSRTLGSVASYKASSSMELRDPIKDAT